MNINSTKLISKLTLLSVFVFNLSNAVNSQESSGIIGAKKSFSEGILITGTLGYNGYFGDLSTEPEKNILPFNNNTKAAFGIGVHKEVIGFLELGVKGMVGKLAEISDDKIPSSNNIYTFTTDIYQVGFKANLNLVNLVRKNENNRLAFLIGAGYGITSYSTESATKRPNGKEIEFPNRVISNKSGSSTTGTLNYGLGLRYNVNDNWAVGIEGTLYTPNVDDIDNWAFEGSDDDRYSFVGINLSYIIPSRNRVIPESKKGPKLVDTPIIKDEVQEVVEEITEEVSEEVTEVVEEPVKETLDAVKPIKKEVTNEAPVASPTVNDFKNDVINFRLNSTIQPDAVKAQVKSIADKLKQFPDVKIKLAGYTDKSGSETYNDNLSLRRANWVKNTLIKEHGIAADRISTIGMGEKGSSKEFNPEDRKVDVIEVK